MKRFVSYFYNRKLRFDILSLFLSLLLISSLTIVSFSYFKNRKVVLDLSKGTITRVSSLIQEKIFCIVDNFQKVCGLGESFLAHFSTISTKNEPLIEFMHAAVKTYSMVEAFYLADAKGNFIEVLDLRESNRPHHLSNSMKSLPENAAYLLRIVERENENASETRYYKDGNFNTIDQETLTTSYDPRKRPWYQIAQDKKGPSWTDIFTFSTTKKPGISISMPSLDQKGNLIGVIGADLPLTILSDFLRELHIGKSGRAFVLNFSGELLLPLNSDHPSSLKKAYQAWEKTQKRKHDFLFNVDGVDYLAFIDPFSFAFEKTWIIAIVAPFEDFFGKTIALQQQVLLISLLILLLSSSLVIYFSKKISTPIVRLAHEVDRIKRLDLDSQTEVKSHIREISLLNRSIVSMRMMLRSFGRYVPKDIVKQLLEEGKEIALGGEKKEITLFFSDISNFTSIAESYGTELMHLLEDYFDRLSKIILNAQGTIDKYIGDSIMAFWGAPKELAHPEKLACKTALECQKVLTNFNETLEKEGKPIFETRIGIHKGKVIVGNIGTHERMNYTAMGDVVNTASRLQHINKTYHTKIIISDEVYQIVKDDFITRPLDIVEVKGKKEKIKIYELISLL